MVRHHCRLREPFASLTCSKFLELFSKYDLMIRKKYQRAIGIDSRAKTYRCTKVLSQPPYQIHCPTTLHAVENEVFVDECVHKCFGITAVESV
jgi:hypothetical protein